MRCRRWALPLVIGVIVGGMLATVSPDRVLKFAFVAFAVLMSFKLLFGRASWTLGNELPGPVLMNTYGFGVGLVSPLIGISGGGIASVILTLYKVPIHQAIATSAGLGALIAVPGTISYIVGGLSHLSELPPLSLGYVSVPGALLVGGIATLGGAARGQAGPRLHQAPARGRVRAVSADRGDAVRGGVVRLSVARGGSSFEARCRAHLRMTWFL